LKCEPKLFLLDLCPSKCWSSFYTLLDTSIDLTRLILIYPLDYMNGQMWGIRYTNSQFKSFTISNKQVKNEIFGFEFHVVIAWWKNCFGPYNLKWMVEMQKCWNRNCVIRVVRSHINGWDQKQRATVFFNYIKELWSEIFFVWCIWLWVWGILAWIQVQINIFEHTQNKNK